MRNEATGKIVLFVLIAGRKQKEVLLPAISAAGGKLLSVIYGQGTVRASYIQDVLGLVHEENKVVIICLMPIEKSVAALKMLEHDFKFDQPNTGIAFTVPVDGLSF